MENQNQQTQPPQAPEINSQMPSINSDSNKSKVIPIVLGVVAVTIIAIGVYLLGTKQNQTPVQNIAQTTPIPTPTSDPAANWKTYTNTKQGFSFKYPPEWDMEVGSQVEEGEIAPALNIHNHYVSDPSKGHYNYYFGDIVGINIKKTSNKSLDQEIQEDIKMSGNIFENIRHFVVDSIEGRRFTFNGQYAVDTVLVKNNEFELEISHRLAVDKSNKNSINKEIFNQILSTFRFLPASPTGGNQSEKVEISNGGTYIGKGFTVIVPKSWEIINGFRFESSNIRLRIMGSNRNEDELAGEYHLGSQAKQTRKVTLGITSGTEYFGCVGVEGCIDMYVIIAKVGSEQYDIVYEQPGMEINDALYKSIISTLKFTQ